MYAAPDNRAATCALTLCLQIAMVSTGCVEVTDLREDEPVADVAVGQIDTGWADTSGRIGCTEKSDCPQGECGTSICNASGICITSPIKDGQPCSDGDPNTVGDLCIDGLCVPGSDVCICEDDNECLPFGNGNQCDGRLICDGCACIPVETPPGTACDDDNPLTVGDSCDANNTCVGTPLCECNVATDCTPEPCKETTCDGCACTQHPAQLGHIDAEEAFAAGVPATWTATSTSDTVFWRQASGGLRVGDSTGLYSGPAVTAELTAESIFIPDTTVLLEVDLALYSAETGCDDRLEVYIDNKLTDTVCGPTPGFSLLPNSVCVLPLPAVP